MTDHAVHNSVSTRSTFRWRVVDIVTASVLGVVCGLIFWLWAAAWSFVEPLFAFFPPASGLLSAGWVLAGPLAGLIIRKPGAALYAEVLAAIVEATLGSHFGFGAIISGLCQGLGAELAFAVLAYRRFGFGTALFSGALAGLALGLNENLLYNTEWLPAWKLTYLGTTAVSGLVIAGVLMWAAVRALARTGALSAFAAGRAKQEV
jgi:energy-coupling factor transport system substrate-specific component